MGLKFNITKKAGKMINANGEEIYDPRFEKYIDSKLEKDKGITTDEGGAEKTQESEKK